VEVHVDYPFEWQVSSKGKPLASNLQQFADTVLADLWSAVSIAIGDDQATDGDDSVDLESKVKKKLRLFACARCARTQLQTLEIISEFCFVISEFCFVYNAFHLFPA